MKRGLLNVDPAANTEAVHPSGRRTKCSEGSSDNAAYFGGTVICTCRRLTGALGVQGIGVVCADTETAATSCSATRNRCGDLMLQSTNDVQKEDDDFDYESRRFKRKVKAKPVIAVKKEVVEEPEDFMFEHQRFQVPDNWEIDIDAI